MPALDALAPRLHAAHTLGMGVSIDSVYSNAAWAAALGGVSVPLLSDFHPKGAVARSMGCYLQDKGIAGRATVFVDANGIVQRASMHSSQRDLDELTRWIEDFDAAFATDLPVLSPEQHLPDGVELFVRDNCMFSRWALYARTNLHLDIAVRNVSQDADARAELERLGGKSQAPALRIGDEVRYESQEIAQFLTEHCGALS